MLIRRVLSLLVAVVLASPAYAIERQQHNRFAGLTVSGAALFADGTVGAPSIAFSTENDGSGTGLYKSGTNTIGFATNGVRRAEMTNSGFLLQTGSILINQFGSAAAPSYTFSSDLDLGVYRANADVLGVSAGGSTVATFDSGGLNIEAGLTLEFTNASTTPDLAFSGSDLTIGAATADGSDNLAAILAGGGAGDPTRGASIIVSGNEDPGNLGHVNINAGTGGGDVFIQGYSDLDVNIGNSLEDGFFLSEGILRFELDDNTTGGNGASANLQRSCVATTTNSGASTQTISNIIPARATVEQVACRVTTILAGSGLTTWSLGPAADPDLYGAGLALAAGTTVTSANYTASPRTQTWSTAAQNLTMTAAAGVFSSGAITCCAYYWNSTGATS